MKKLYVIPSIIVALALGFGIGCVYHCEKNKIAVIDLPAVVSQSSKVTELKKEKNTAEKEIRKWLNESQKAVNDEKDKEKQEELLKQYREDFAVKRQEIAQSYLEKLRDAEESINKIISDEAQKKGYSMVLTKGLTVYGGDDITQDVIKAVK